MKENKVHQQKHPNPMFSRKNIYLMDGEWEISIDGGAWQKIRVPYCPESALSGIGHTDFIGRCRYRKKFTVPEEVKGDRIALHFGAVDHRAEVYVNGSLAGSHSGGYTPFSFDVAPLLREGENLLEVEVTAAVKKNVPTGKQSQKSESFGCFYTRATGIWQSVYLEGTPAHFMQYVRFVPDVAGCRVRMEVGAVGEEEFSAVVFYEGKEVGRTAGKFVHKGEFTVDLSEKHLWEVGCGRLYDVELRFGEDTVYTYFGLRDVRFDGYKFLLNGKSVFQRLVLDQGYYPDGVYTPSSEEVFEQDIRRAVGLGFNGARLHQKLFDPKYLCLCDRMGFMVWGEYASWGMEYYDLDGLGNFIGEWREAVERDYNHPSIVVWCPLNETWNDLDDETKPRDVRFVEAVYDITKILDKTRPCVDVSGGFHCSRTDIADFHCYEEFDVLKKRMENAIAGKPDFLNMYREGEGISYGGEPLHLSEFGGIRLNSGKEEGGNAWGYLTANGEEAFADNYVKTIELLYGYEQLCGVCYTQLYDIEQEANGFFTYDRQPKFSEKVMERIRAANKMPAAIEKQNK